MTRCLQQRRKSTPQLPTGQVHSQNIPLACVHCQKFAPATSRQGNKRRLATNRQRNKRLRSEQVKEQMPASNKQVRERVPASSEQVWEKVPAGSEQVREQTPAGNEQVREPGPASNEQVREQVPQTSCHVGDAFGNAFGQSGAHGIRILQFILRVGCQLPPIPARC